MDLQVGAKFTISESLPGSFQVANMAEHVTVVSRAHTYRGYQLLMVMESVGMHLKNGGTH
jgi:hypothetical protein